MATTFQHWQEWRARCAALRCGSETRSALQTFAAQRFQRYARAVLGEPDVGPQLPAPGECWHLLESELAAGRLRSGRRYKEWLFARLEGSRDAPIDVVQGGASLLLRTVVRNWARRETRQRQTCPLEMPVGVPGGRLTLADLLPAPPAGDPEASELERLGDAEAGALFASLPTLPRHVLLAKQLGLPLYGAELLAHVGSSRSGVSLVWRGVFQQLARQVAQRYPEEPRDWQLRLGLQAARKLEQLIFSWGRLEKSAQVLFHMVERRDPAAAQNAARNDRHEA